MPPYIIVNSTASNNATFPGTRPPSTVSWQSAFWPLVASALAVMLQNTGRVCGGPYKASFVFRSSPFVCIVDVVFMVFKFFALLVVGCSFRVAAMHVWFDRFQSKLGNSDCENWFYIFEDIISWTGSNKSTNDLSISAGDVGDQTTIAMIHESSVDDNNGSRGFEMARESDVVAENNPLLPSRGGPVTHPGSGIDREWRLNVAGFVLGALPQAVKVFGMSGIPLTQTLVAFYLISFLVPEMFRAVAGPAGVVDLRPMPIVSDMKKKIHLWQNACLLIASLFGWIFAHNYLIFWVAYIKHDTPDGPVLIWREWGLLLPTATFFAPLVNIFLTAGVYLLLVLASNCLLRTGHLSNAIRRKVRKHILDQFDFSFAYSVCMPASLIATYHFSRWALYVRHSGKRAIEEGETHAIQLLSVYVEPILLIISYGLFGIIFVGPLSKYPRKLFGLEGNFFEFATGTYFLLNLAFAFLGYACYEDFATNTFKPAWAEYLG